MRAPSRSPHAQLNRLAVALVEQVLARENDAASPWPCIVCTNGFANSSNTALQCAGGRLHRPKASHASVVVRSSVRRCQNVEAQIMTRLPVLLGPSMANEATAIAEYYLFDTGGSFTDMLQAAVGINIPGMLANFNATRDTEIAVRLMQPWPCTLACTFCLWFADELGTCSTLCTGLRGFMNFGCRPSSLGACHLGWPHHPHSWHGHPFCVPDRSDTHDAETSLRLLLQSLQGQFVLRAKLTAVVDRVINVSGAVEHDLTSAEALASYESIHPLYLQAGPSRFAMCQALMLNCSGAR